MSFNKNYYGIISYPFNLTVHFLKYLLSNFKIIREKSETFKDYKPLFSKMKLLKDIPFFSKLFEILNAVILIVVVSLLIGLILAFPVMLLWNFVFPIYKINVFQAWALNVLAGILFGQKNSSSQWNENNCSNKIIFIES